MKNNKLSLISSSSLALVIAFAAVGCVDRKAQVSAAETGKIIGDPIRQISVTPVIVKDIVEKLEINGEVVTSQDAQISSQSGGKLVRVDVKDGDTVTAGQVIATLDNENLRYQSDQARAGLSSAQSQLNQAIRNAKLTPSRSKAAVKQAEAALRGSRIQLQKSLNGARSEEREQTQINLRSAKSNLQTSKKQLERIKTLVSEGALAESQLDEAKNAYEIALAQYENAVQSASLIKSTVRPEDIAADRENVRQAEQGLESAKASLRLDSLLTDQIASAKAQVQSAQATLLVAEKNLREAKVRSPFTGRIYGRPLQAGTVINPGTPVARIVGTNGIYFEGQVPSNKIQNVKLGTEVEVTVDAIKGSTLPGTVLAISPIGEDIGRLFNVRIQLKSYVGGVKPGMYARGSVTLSTLPNATLVPTTAIINRDGKNYVMAAVGNKAKKIFVTPGVRQGDLIDAKGLPSDTSVITSGQGALVDGSKIKVVTK
jgi:RND family efflux transporter MFP subunit